MKTLQGMRKISSSLENKKMNASSLAAVSGAKRGGSSVVSSYTNSIGCPDVDFYDANGKFLGRFYQFSPGAEIVLLP